MSDNTSGFIGSGGGSFGSESYHSFDPFAPHFRLTSQVLRGSSRIFTNALKSDFPNGSTVLISQAEFGVDETVKITSYNSDGSFSIYPSLTKDYLVNSEVSLISVPEHKYLVDNSPCKIVFENKNILYNFSVGLDKTYTFTFDSREAFDQFEFLNYGEHSVVSSYPTIKLKASPVGPKEFTYKTFSSYGKVSIVDNCDSCSDLKFEIFTSSDDIIYHEDVKKYLINCGSSQFSTSILDVKVLNCDCDQNTFLVTYCCDLSKDVSTDYCVASWKTLCKDDISGEIEISAPTLSCEKNNITFDSWLYSSSSNSLTYNRKIHFCYKGCTSYDFNPLFLVDPSQPTENQWKSCPCHAVTPTETITPTEIVSSYVIDENIINGVHLAGDKPYFIDSSCLVGVSKVLNKINSSDLSHRVFYKDSNNGYFFESSAALKSLHPTESLTSDYKKVNGFNFYLKDENLLQKSKTDKGGMFTDHFFNFVTNTTKNSFVSIVDYENPPPTPSLPINNDLIKDESLFYKLFTKNSSTMGQLLNSTVAQLNWRYWFSDLPKLIYGQDNWWVGLKNSEMPSFEIMQVSSDLSESQYQFESGSNKVSPVISNGTFLSDNFSLINLKSLPSDYSFDLKKNRHFNITIEDPIYNLKIITHSYSVKLTVEYSFNPKESLISTDYSAFNYPIKRKEEVLIHLNAYEGFNANAGVKNFPYNYAKDKTLGVTNPVYNLVQGMGVRYS